MVFEVLVIRVSYYLDELASRLRRYFQSPVTYFLYETVVYEHFYSENNRDFVIEAGYQHFFLKNNSISGYRGVL